MDTLYGIITIGARGTGSLFLSDFCRFLGASEKAGNATDLIIVDGDKVEEKNLSRQAFVEEDIGKNKAEAMAEAINDTFNLNIRALARYVETPEEILSLVELLYAMAKEKSPYREFSFLPILISCVDNIACRLQIEEVFRRLDDCFYIDSGNGYRNGQCIYAVKRAGKVISPMRDGYNVSYDEEDLRSRTQISCEELNQVAPQHVLTNRMAALNITKAMILLVETGMTMRGIVTFDAFLGTSQLIAPETFGFKAQKRKSRKKTS